MGTTVTSKGQVTIPRKVRDLLGIRPGTTVDFVVAEDGRIYLVRAGRTSSRRGAVADIRGRATAGMTTGQVMALTRGDLKSRF